MDIPSLIRIAKATATAHGIRPELFCGLVEHESSWDPWAMKYEPNFYTRYIAHMDLDVTEKITRSTSYGLCQVMGEVAREHGFTQRFLSELCDPVVGLEYGARKLKECIDKAAGNETVALMRYNGGSDGSYPDVVLKCSKNYGAVTA